MEIKYSMEGFIKYLKIKQCVTRSEDDNMQNQHCSCITGYD